MKICSKCQIPQPLENFRNYNRSKDGKVSQCKVCDKYYYEINKEKILLRCNLRYENNKEYILNKIKQYQKNNKEYIYNRTKQHYKENKETISSKKKQYREKNKEKLALKSKQYREENKERVSEIKKQWWKTNRENAIIKKKRYYETNKEVYSVKARIWRDTLSGQVSAKNSRHKRRTITKQGDVTNEQLQTLLDNSTHCFYCNNPLVLNNVHIDHYIPLSKGGLHTISNLRIACQKCNLSKWNKMPEELAEWLIQHGLEVKEVQNGK